MAGIGFRLQKILQGRSYTDFTRAYLFSTVIASGPSLLVMVSLALLRYQLQSSFNMEDQKLLVSLFAYLYAFSMIVVGPCLYVVTRYLADMEYLGKLSVYSPTYFSLLKILFLVASIVEWAFIYNLAIPFSAKVILWVLFLLIVGVWIALTFISILRSYGWIVFAFFSGAVASLLLSIPFTNYWGWQGFIGAYTLGQGLIFFILSIRLVTELGMPFQNDFSFLSYFKKQHYLVWICTFYFAGNWIDKFIFWSSPNAERVLGKLATCPLYDAPIFLAFLTIVPSMAFFLLQMESTFAKNYHFYFESIRRRLPLSSILEQKHKMLTQLYGHFKQFIFFQGIVSLFIVLMMEEICKFFMIAPHQMGIFRIGVLGAFLQMMFVMLLTLLFYFDFLREAFWMSLLYFVSNAFFTLITLQIGLASYGYGITFACFISAFFSFLILDVRLRDLEYYTFMKQPVSLTEFAYEDELF